MATTTQECILSLCSTSRTSRRASPTPSVEITTKLPCTLDQDLDEVPRPNYTSDDIARVQRMLLNFVPAELADAILDMAEYWPYVGTSRNDFSTSYSALDGPDQNAQWCYMVSPKIPSVERGGHRVTTTVKKVKFSIKAYESAWGTPAEKTVPSKASKTWFEASVLKHGESAELPDYSDDVRPNDWFAKLAPHPKYLNELRGTDYAGCGPRVENPFDAKQRWHVANSPESTADRKWHETVWKHDDKNLAGGNSEVDPDSGKGSGSGFLGSLSVDDRIILMARAPAPGLINTIFNVKLEVYYALSSSYL